MNIAWSIFGGSIIRILLSVIGGWLLTLGFTQDQVNAISAQVSSGHSPGLIAAGIVTIAVPVLWARYRAKITTLVDSAVHHTGGSASPLAAAAPVAKAKALTATAPKV